MKYGEVFNEMGLRHITHYNRKLKDYFDIIKKTFIIVMLLKERRKCE